MLWSALATFAGNAEQGGGGAPGRDLRSLPNIHFGSYLSNASDPFNIFGGSGSNIGANLTNPAGFGAIHGDVPNNNPDPSAQPGYGSNPGGVTTYPGMSTGMTPQQMAALAQMGGGGNLGNAYAGFMRSLGGPTPLPYPTAPSPQNNQMASLAKLSQLNSVPSGRNIQRF